MTHVTRSPCRGAARGRAPRASSARSTSFSSKRQRGAAGLAACALLLALGIAPPAEAQPGAELPDNGGLECTPDTPEMQTRRPIPFDCRSDGEAVRVSVRYREHPDAPWRTLELPRDGESFRATLGCEVTMNSGRLQYFIVATDGAGDPVDTIGSKNAPVELVLNPQSTVAPAYPGEEPPERCEERVLCPPDFPGCDDPDAAARAKPAASKPPVQWLGIAFAADIGFLGGSNVCTSNNPDYDCFFAGTDTPFPGALPDGVAMPPGELGDGYPGTDIATSPSVGTLRLLISYERAVSDRL